MTIDGLYFIFGKECFRKCEAKFYHMCFLSEVFFYRGLIGKIFFHFTTVRSVDSLMLFDNLETYC